MFDMKEVRKVIDSNTRQWRDGADRLLLALAQENKFIVSDMLIIYLEASGYKLDNYSAIGGVFRRAAKLSLIKRVERPTKQRLWRSMVYGKQL